MRFVWMATVVGALMSSGAFAQGSEFPSKPIREVVGFAAGSGADSTARLVAEQMQRTLGQPVLVDNKPGASGAIAVQHVKAQPADGHTILLASYSPMSVNPIVMKHPGYDPVTDFKAVHGLVRSATAWFVANESPYRTIGDLIAAGKRKPLTIGSYGAGYQLSIAWLANLGGVMALIQSGKLRALAVASDKRETLGYLEARNSMALNLGPEAMARYLRDEIARFRRVAEAAGIMPE